MVRCYCTRVILSTVILRALVIAQVALFAYYVRANLIAQPYWDMLSIVTRYLQWVRDGNLWAYLWEPHVQHRQVWMRLLTMFDATAFAGVGYPFVVVAVACQLTTAWVLWREARQGVPGEGGTRLACLTAMLVLTSVAAVDCAIPMNGIYPQTVVLVVGAILLTESAGQSASRRLLGIVVAMLAAFGSATALAVWPILLWLSWRAGAGRLWAATTVLVGGIFSAIYLRGIPGVAIDATMPWEGLTGAWRSADYLVTYMGLPWTRAAVTATGGKVLGGALFALSCGLCLWCGIVRPVSSRLDRIALALIAFSTATAVLAAVGRSAVDVDLRVPVRYSVLVAPLHVGLVFLVWPRLIARWGGRAHWHDPVVGAIALLLVAQQIVSGRAAVATTKAMRETLARFAAGEETDDMKSVVYVDLTQARRDHDAIKAAGLYLTAR